MKRFFATLMMGMLLIGAGCSSSDSGMQTVTGWHLNVELPEGWVMVPHYGDDVVQPTSHEVNVDLSDVVIQSTEMPILLDEASRVENVPYAEGDQAYIRVFKFSERKVIPSEAEDLGNGFYQIEEDGQMLVWLDGEQGKYKFMLTVSESMMDQAMTVILSSTEVVIDDASDE